MTEVVVLFLLIVVRVLDVFALSLKVQRIQMHALYDRHARARSGVWGAIVMHAVVVQYIAADASSKETRT